MFTFFTNRNFHVFLHFKKNRIELKYILYIYCFKFYCRKIFFLVSYRFRMSSCSETVFGASEERRRPSVQLRQKKPDERCAVHTGNATPPAVVYGGGSGETEHAPADTCRRRTRFLFLLLFFRRVRMFTRQTATTTTTTAFSPNRQVCRFSTVYFRTEQKETNLT